MFYLTVKWKQTHEKIVQETYHNANNMQTIIKGI